MRWIGALLTLLPRTLKQSSSGTLTIYVYKNLRQACSCCLGIKETHLGWITPAPSRCKSAFTWLMTRCNYTGPGAPGPGTSLTDGGGHVQTLSGLEAASSIGGGVDVPMPQTEGQTPTQTKVPPLPGFLAAKAQKVQLNTIRFRPPGPGP